MPRYTTAKIRRIVASTFILRVCGRAQVYAIRYVAPHVRQRGDMNSATLVRGKDRYDYFARDPVPGRDMDPAIAAFVDRPYGGTPLGKTGTAR